MICYLGLGANLGNREEYLINAITRIDAYKGIYVVNKSGFYETKLDGFSHEECEQIFIKNITDNNLFESNLNRVIKEWVYSCEILSLLYID